MYPGIFSRSTGICTLGLIYIVYFINSFFLNLFSTIIIHSPTVVVNQKYRWQFIYILAKTIGSLDSVRTIIKSLSSK